MLSVESEQIGSTIRLVLLLAVLMAFAGEAMGEQLPIKSYTTADGLPHNRVKRVVQDSHGFFWFCTAGGLSRFDGYQFTNYTVDNGLPVPSVNDLLETGDGDYWVATNSDGLIHFNPLTDARHPEGLRFTVYGISNEPAANRVNLLYKDRAGLLWAGLTAGCFIWTKRNLRASFSASSFPYRRTRTYRCRYGRWPKMRRAVCGSAQRLAWFIACPMAE